MSSYTLPTMVGVTAEMLIALPHSRQAVVIFVSGNDCSRDIPFARHSRCERKGHSGHIRLGRLAITALRRATYAHVRMSVCIKLTTIIGNTQTTDCPGEHPAFMNSQRKSVTLSLIFV